MENDTYLTIVTNQVKNVSHDPFNAIGYKTHYVKYTVEGASALDEVPISSVAGQTFLILDYKKDLWIPLSIVTKAYSGSESADAKYEWLEE